MLSLNPGYTSVALRHPSTDSGSTWFSLLTEPAPVELCTALTWELPHLIIIIISIIIIKNEAGNIKTIACLSSMFSMLLLKVYVILIGVIVAYCYLVPVMNYRLPTTGFVVANPSEATMDSWGLLRPNKDI